MTKEVAGVRYASVVSLPGDLERELHETVRMKLGFPQRPLNVEDKAVVRYLLKKDKKREQKWPKRHTYIAVNKAQRN